ncbi:hypothetical protein D3C71_1247520 [compost metagenome]
MKRTALTGVFIKMRQAVAEGFPDRKEHGYPILGVIYWSFFKLIKLNLRRTISEAWKRRFGICPCRFPSWKRSLLLPRNKPKRYALIFAKRVRLLSELRRN